MAGLCSAMNCETAQYHQPIGSQNLPPPLNPTQLRSAPQVRRQRWKARHARGSCVDDARSRNPGAIRRLSLNKSHEGVVHPINFGRRLMQRHQVPIGRIQKTTDYRTVYANYRSDPAPGSAQLSRMTFSTNLRQISVFRTNKLRVNSR